MLEAVRAQGLITSELSEVFGDYLFFEHGARTADCGGCGITHAHLHALPLRVDGVLPSLKKQFSHVAVKSITELTRVATDRSYLYYEESPRQGWVFFPAKLPSQYIRRLLADGAGISQWDWRQSGHEKSLLATRDEVASLLSAFA